MTDNNINILPEASAKNTRLLKYAIMGWVLLTPAFIYSFIYALSLLPGDYFNLNEIIFKRLTFFSSEVELDGPSISELVFILIYASAIVGFVINALVFITAIFFSRKTYRPLLIILGALLYLFIIASLYFWIKGLNEAEIGISMNAPDNSACQEKLYFLGVSFREGTTDKEIDAALRSIGLSIGDFDYLEGKDQDLTFLIDRWLTYDYKVKVARSQFENWQKKLAALAIIKHVGRGKFSGECAQAF